MTNQPILKAPDIRTRTQAWDANRRSKQRLHPPASEKRSAVERLDCYRLALELSVLAASLIPRGHASLRNQLERATTSGVLNLAEGWGRWQIREKSHFYTIARGSVLESAAVIDLLRARNLADEDDCIRARAIALRVAQMLGGLIRSVGSRMTPGGVG